MGVSSKLAKLVSLAVDPHRRGELVVGSPAASLVLESGSEQVLAESGPVALVSSWSEAPQMSRSLSTYLAELVRLGYRPIVISTAEFKEPLSWPQGLPDEALVYRRPNRGYDFGSWAAGLELPGIAARDRVLLTNDSMVGPFTDLTAIEEAAKRSDADIFSLVESNQMKKHPQSFFLEFRGGILDEKPWRRFFRGVRHQAEKMSVVEAYEVNLGEHAEQAGYSWEAMVPAYLQGSKLDNPTLTSWRLLLESGIPFLKRGLITSPLHWHTAQQMARAAADLYGEDVSEWLPEGLTLAGRSPSAVH